MATLNLSQDSNNIQWSICSTLLRRKLGFFKPQQYQKEVITWQYQFPTRLQYRDSALQKNWPFNSVTCMDLEKIDNRYLLCGFTNGAVAIYDAAKIDFNSSILKEQPDFFREINRTKTASRFKATCIQWYPKDNGIFTTSNDEISKLQVWDSNSLKEVDNYVVDDAGHVHISHHDMSCLSEMVALGLNSGHIRLVDLSTGSSLQELKMRDYSSSNKNPVTYVKWHPSNKGILASGHKDGRICLWDIRRGSSLVSDSTSTMKKHYNYSDLREVIRLEYHSDKCSLVSLHPRTVSLWDNCNLKDPAHSHIFGSSFNMDHIRVSQRTGFAFIFSRNEMRIYDLKRGSLVSKPLIVGAVAHAELDENHNRVILLNPFHIINTLAFYQGNKDYSKHNSVIALRKKQVQLGELKLVKPTNYTTSSNKNLQAQPNVKNSMSNDHGRTSSSKSGKRKLCKDSKGESYSTKRKFTCSNKEIGNSNTNTSGMQVDINKPSCSYSRNKSDDLSECLEMYRNILNKVHRIPVVPDTWSSDED